MLPFSGGGLMTHEQEIRKLQRELADDPQNREILFKLSCLSVEDHDLTAATSHIEHCLATNPNHINARYLSGVISTLNGSYDHAMREFKAIVDIDGDYRFQEVDFAVIAGLPEAIEAWKKFEEKEKESAGRELTLGFVYYALRDYDKSIEHLNLAITFNERLDLTHSLLGLALMEKKDYENAIKAFSTEFSANPRAYGALFHTGRCNYTIGRISQATQALEKVVKLRPSHAKAHYYLGLCYAAQSLYIQAEGYLMHAIESRPQFADAHFQLGAIYHQQYKMEEAVSEYELALKVNPHHKDATLKLAEALKSMGRIEEALRHLHAASLIAPNEPSIYSQLGTIHFQRKEYGEAVENLKKSLLLEQDNEAVLYTLGEALSQLGEPAKAVEAYRTYLSFRPGDPALRKNLGIALLKADDIGGAAGEFTRALDLNPRDTSSSTYAGICSLILKDDRRAVELFRRLLAENPADPLALILIGAARLRDRGVDDGQKAIEEGIELLKKTNLDPLFFALLRLFAAASIDQGALPQRLDVLGMQARSAAFAVVKTLMNALDLKASYYRYHSQRVSRIGKMLAVHLRKADPALVEEPAVTDIEIGGLLHDIGMLTIPDYVVQKEGKLTREELAVFRRHPHEGAKILHGISLPWNVIPIVRWHHERVDGKGYPDMLPFDKTPATAVITGIADSFDDLVNDKPAEESRSAHEAIALMKKERDTAFPSRFLDSFCDIAPHLEPHLADIPPWRRT
jgi:tetratricopeptide (TPR) repeat protein